MSEHQNGEYIAELHRHIRTVETYADCDARLRSIKLT
jgi:hypothetical protein